MATISVGIVGGLRLSRNQEECVEEWSAQDLIEIYEIANFGEIEW